MIVETQDLACRFGRQEAIRGVSLAVPQGAALALVGANGAGKTTLLRLLLGVLRPDAGSALVLGKDSRHLGAADFRRIGHVAEDKVLPEGLSVAHYFDYLRPLYPSWDRALETELRAKLRLPADQRLRTLSRGTRMKAMLASALAFRPALLLLDEPLSGLDPLVRDELIDGLIGLADETTILISSHELADIENFATDIAFLQDGRLLFQNHMDEFAARFRHVRGSCAATPQWREGLPASWLAPQLFERSFSFIDSAFTGEAELAARLTQILGPIEHLETWPLPLRDISKALMAAGRKEEA